MNEAQMAVLLLRISAALASKDTRRAAGLVDAGLTMLNGSEAEREATWREIMNGRSGA
jgi:hypothetical protein